MSWIPRTARAAPIPTPLVWCPHPALEMLKSTVILLSSCKLSPAHFTTIHESVMAVHDLIASEDDKSVLSHEAAVLKLCDVSISRTDVIVASGWQLGWGMRPEEELEGRRDDDRGTWGWQNGWEWNGEPADVGAQLQERPTGRLRPSSIDGNNVRLQVLLRRGLLIFTTRLWTKICLLARPSRAFALRRNGRSGRRNSTSTAALIL